MGAALVSLLGSLGSTLLSGGLGVGQGMTAKRLAKDNVRPVKDVSQSTKDLVNASRTQAGKYGFAGQAQQQAQLDRQSAAAARAISQGAYSSSATMGALGNVDYNTKSAQGVMAQQAAKSKENAMGTYYNALQQQAVEEQNVWDYNKRQKYEENAAAISALTQSANANLNTAFNTLSGGLYDYAAGTYDTGGKYAPTTGASGIGGASDSYSPPKYNPQFNMSVPQPNMARMAQPQAQPQYNMDQLGQIYDLDNQRSQLESMYGPLSDAQLRMFLLNGG